MGMISALQMIYASRMEKWIFYDFTKPTLIVFDQGGFLFCLAIESIQLPAKWIFLNILCDFKIILFISDDMVIECTLPDLFVKRRKNAIFHGFDVLDGGKPFKALDNG